MTLLEELNLVHSTVVAIIGDHGYSLGEHNMSVVLFPLWIVWQSACSLTSTCFADIDMLCWLLHRWSKQTNFEIAARIPLIIRAAGQQKNSTVNGLAEVRICRS